MTENAVLDKGVILGYCFFSDPHHERCSEYVEIEETDYFTTKEIEEIFEAKKNEFITKHRRSILNHIRKVTSEYSGELSDNDIEDIQAGIDGEENDAWRYLLDFYQGRIGQNVYEVTNELRNLAGDIEQRAEERREVLYPHLMGWIRIDSHNVVQERLEPLRERDEEDFWICIDAHDIAANIDGETELATTNPSDFGVDEIEELILEHTELDNIEFVFVSSSYEPDSQ